MNFYLAFGAVGILAQILTLQHLRPRCSGGTPRTSRNTLKQRTFLRRDCLLTDKIFSKRILLPPKRFSRSIMSRSPPAQEASGKKKPAHFRSTRASQKCNERTIVHLYKSPRSVLSLPMYHPLLRGRQQTPRVSVRKGPKRREAESPRVAINKKYLFPVSDTLSSRLLRGGTN